MAIMIKKQKNWYVGVWRGGKGIGAEFASVKIFG
jgi:hypothetical protein